MRRFLRGLKLWTKHWGALAVAVLALATSLWSAREDRLHKRMSVRPHLTLEAFYEDPKVGWRLLNRGSGPAVVRSFAVYVDDKSQPTWEAFARALGLPELRGLRHHVANLFTDELLLAPSGTELFTVSDKNAGYVERNWNRVYMEVCYCSLYDECWRVSSFVGSRKPVHVCDAPRRDPTSWLGTAPPR